MVSFGVQMSPRQALNFEIFNFHEYLWCSSAKRENLEEEKCVLSGLIVRKIKKLKNCWVWLEMNRKARDFESRRQIEDLNRYRKQNADLMREADHTIQATSKYKLTDFNPQWKNQKNLRLRWAKLDRLFVAIRKTPKRPKFKSV